MQDLADIAWDVLQDAFFDTLYLVPFLFVTYLFMEWLEHRTGDAAQRAIQKAGKAGPLIGAFLGAVPQCGFSAATSTLYAARVVSLGTLLAVFLSTSDEMLPIFIAEQVPAGVLFGVIGIKIVIGVIAGFSADAFLRAIHRNHVNPHIHELCEDAGCECGHEDRSIFRSAVRHTVQVTLFVFLVSLALDAVLELVGEEALAAFLGSNSVLSVVGAAVVGLVPNCAASVAIAQLYVEGALGFGAMLAGLLSAAGVGMLVLLRTNRRPKENALIVLVLVGISALCGLAFQLSGFSL